MGDVTPLFRTRFAVGQLVSHNKFRYRGVIVDVDPTFQGTDEWYDAVARSRPPKNKPWYHVLVHDATHTTYVAERHLDADDSAEPIRHPLVKRFFARFENGRYRSERPPN